jgi:hypothetical protein
LTQKKARDDTYGCHDVLPDAQHEDRRTKITSIAGPDCTDQIARAVYNGGREGTDPNPEKRRDYLVPGGPGSFKPFEE